MAKKDIKVGRCYFLSTDKEDNPKLGAKLLTDGRESLFLEYYFGYEMTCDEASGKMKARKNRRRESLKLYLWHNPRTPQQRQDNKQALIIAKQLRNDKAKELLDQERGYKLQTKKESINFLDYFQVYLEAYTKKDIRVIQSALRHFQAFLHETPEYKVFERKIKPEQVTSTMIEAFTEYLRGKCTGEGAKSVYQRFKKVFKSCAIKCDINHQRPFVDADGKSITITTDEGSITKDILSADEARRMMDTHYKGENSEIRDAFIFSLYTGMRYCDVKALTFGNIDMARMMLTYDQSKTKGHSKHSNVALPLNGALLALIADKAATAGKDELVFNLPSHTMCLKALRTWTRKAGIDKHITWHCARHSFGTNMATAAAQNGFSIRVVQEMMGHSNLRFTERYTRVADEQKKTAMAALASMMQ
jgi:integrase